MIAIFLTKLALVLNYVFVGVGLGAGFKIIEAIKNSNRIEQGWVIGTENVKIAYRKLRDKVQSYQPQAA